MNRLFSATWLYIVAGVFPFVIAVLGFATLLVSPYLGVDFELGNDGWYIASVDADGPAGHLSGLAGSRVTALGGHEIGGYDLVEDFDYIPDRESLRNWWRAQRYFSDTIVKGVHVSLAVDDESGGNEYIVPQQFPVTSALNRVWLMFFLGLFSLIVGLSVVLKKPDDTRARIFFFMVLSVALIFVTFGTYTSRSISIPIGFFALLRVINVIAFSYFPVLFFHFCIVFPDRKKPAGSAAFLYILYALPVAVSLLYQPRISYLSLNLLFMAGLVGGVAMFVHSYFTTRSLEDKYRIRWVLWGVGVFAAVFLGTTFLPILFQGQRLFSDRVPSLFFILVPLSMSFAITKYHLMDIDTVFDNTIIYMATLVVIAVLDFGVLSLMAHLGTFAAGIHEPLSTIIALWLAVIAYVPVRNVINRGVKRALKRDVYDSQELTLTLGNRLLRAGNARAVIDETIAVIEPVMHPKGIDACLMKREADGSFSTPCPAIEDRPEIDMTSLCENLDAPRPLFQFTHDIGKLPVDYTGAVLVPLRASMGVVGCILLKNKLSGRLYSSSDLMTLRTLANQASMAIESLFHKEESELRERESREEKERLSREIHDGIGGSFSNAIMMLDLVGEKMAGSDESGRLEHLKNLLTEGLAELRDLIWTIEEDECRLGDLVPLIREKTDSALGNGGISSAFEVSMENPEIVLPAKTRLNLIRIVQEALANIVRHAHATEVRIGIEGAGGIIRLTIIDNGDGFDPPASHTGGFGLRNMQKRCEEMGGEFVMESQPGGGTRIGISLQSESWDAPS